MNRTQLEGRESEAVWHERPSEDRTRHPGSDSPPSFPVSDLDETPWIRPGHRRLGRNSLDQTWTAALGTDKRERRIQRGEENPSSANSRELHD